MMSTFSISARNKRLHMPDHLTFIQSHAKMYGGIDIQQVDGVYGYLEEGPKAPLYGGRVLDDNKEPELYLEDVQFLYSNNIGIKIPLSAYPKYTEQEYQETKPLLEIYHEEINTVIVAIDELALRIRQDFPKFKIEASAVRNINNITKFNSVVDIYDIVCLPLEANDNLEFLQEIPDKSKVRLFVNAECSYNCPNKICYKSISEVNKGDLKTTTCSAYGLKMPRKFYKDDIDWTKFYFPIKDYEDMGYSLFKVLSPRDTIGNVRFMYSDFYKDKQEK